MRAPSLRSIALLALSVATNLFSTNVPSDYVVYSTADLTIGDRAGSTSDGKIGSGTLINVGSDARITGSVYCSGNVNLYDRSVVSRDVKTGGSVVLYSGAVVNGTVTQNTTVETYTIPVKSFSTGTQNVTVPLNNSTTISPGNYGDISILDRATVTFTDGVFNVKSLKIGNDVKIKLNFPVNGKIEINSLGDLTFGDRAAMSFVDCNNGYAVKFYSAGTNDVAVGYNDTISGSFTAPNAMAIIHDRTLFTGSVYAKRVELQPSIYYETDITSPVIQIRNPAANSYISSGTPKISIDFSDNKSGVDFSTLSILVNGIDRTSLFQIVADSAVWQVPTAMELPEGQNTISVDVSDRSGNSTHTQSNFKVDYSNPVITFDSPQNGTISANDTPYVLIKYSDAKTGIKISTFSISLNGSNITGKFNVGKDSSFYKFTSSDHLMTGTNTFSASVSDSSGNSSTTSIQYTVTKEAPVVNIISPVEGTLTNHNPIQVRWTVGGVEQSTQTSEQLSEGSNTIIRSFTNQYGITGSDTVHVTLDTHAPVVAITSPANGFITNQTPVNVSWTIDGILQTTQLSQQLTEGENLIIRSSTDAAGNIGSDTIRVTLDTHAPVVAITSPAKGFITNQTPINVSWTVDGTVQTNQLSQQLTEGENLIIRSSIDAAGNIGSDTVRVTLDTHAPVVAITSPANGFITNQNTVNVSWTIDGTVQTTQLTQQVTEGENLIIRSSTDAAGNTGSDTVRVTLDTHAPVVAITSPAHGFITNQTPVNVSWTVDGTLQITQLSQQLTEGENLIIRSSTDVAGNVGSDTVRVTLDTHAPVVIITSPANGFITNRTPINVSWTIDGTMQTTQLSQQLIEGENLIIRSSIDAAGNIGSDTVRVTLDTHAPVVAITSPAHGFITNQTPVNVSWTVDGTLQTTQLSQQLTEGENLIIRSSTDAAGNIGSDTVRVTLDTHAPVVAITSPTRGFITNHTPVNVNWTVDGTVQTTQLSQQLTEGENLIVRSSTDAAGNIGSDTVRVTLDTHAPVVAITSPAKGFITNHTPVNVSWTIDGAVQTTQLTQQLTEGENLIIRSSIDAAGNTGSDTVRVTLDTHASVVAITSPAKGFITNQTTVNVSWTIDGTVQTTQLTQQLTEGENLIIRSSIDAAGNIGSDTVRVTLDTHAPVVAITSPAHGFITNQTTVNVSWTIDGTVQTTQLTQQLTEGENLIIRSSIDAAGNTGSDTVRVILDTHAPVVAITSPIDGTETQDSVINVSWTVDGVQQTSGLSERLQEGDNSIIRTASDPAGNTGADTVHVRYETCIKINNTILTINRGDNSYDGKSICLTNSSLNVYGFHSFLTVNAQNSKIIVDTGFASSDLELKSSSTITHLATNQNHEYGLKIISDRVSIDLTSSINASGMGYIGDSCFASGLFRGARTQGNVVADYLSNSSSILSTAGGSYGGTGGTSTGRANPVYGSPFYPSELGTGGGAYRCFTYIWGGNGGGRIWIESKFVENYGSIKANGQTSTANGGGGSGGSIYISTDTLCGTGVIQANGGSGYYGGGGGRIALNTAVFTMNKDSVSALGIINGKNGTVVLSTGSVNGPKNLYVMNPSRAAGFDLSVKIDSSVTSYDGGLIYVNNSALRIEGNHPFSNIFAASGFFVGTHNILYSSLSET